MADPDEHASELQSLRAGVDGDIDSSKSVTESKLSSPEKEPRSKSISSDDDPKTCPQPQSSEIDPEVGNGTVTCFLGDRGLDLARIGGVVA